jgi:hypothetical protein
MCFVWLDMLVFHRFLGAIPDKWECRYHRWHKSWSSKTSGLIRSSVMSELYSLKSTVTSTLLHNHCFSFYVIEYVSVFIEYYNYLSLWIRNAAKRKILVCQFREIKVSIFGARTRTSPSKWTNTAGNIIGSFFRSSWCFLSSDSRTRSGTDASTSLTLIYAVSLSHVHYGFNHLQVDYLNLKSNQRLKFRSNLSAESKKSWIMERVNLWFLICHM